jgi:hypothetical protein
MFQAYAHDLSALLAFVSSGYLFKVNEPAQVPAGKIGEHRGDELWDKLQVLATRRTEADRIDMAASVQARTRKLEANALMSCRYIVDGLCMNWQTCVKPAIEGTTKCLGCSNGATGGAEARRRAAEAGRVDDFIAEQALRFAGDQDAWANNELKVLQLRYDLRHNLTMETRVREHGERPEMGDVDLGNWPGNGATGDVTSQPAAVPDLQALQLVMGVVVLPRAVKPRASDPRFAPGQENAELRNGKNQAEQMVLLQSRRIAEMQRDTAALRELLSQLKQQEGGCGLDSGDGLGGSGAGGAYGDDAGSSGAGGAGAAVDGPAEESPVASWLNGLRPDLEKYAVKMAEFGFVDTAWLRDADETDVAACFAELEVAPLHRRIISRGIMALSH